MTTVYDVSNHNHTINFIFLISIRDLNPLYDVTIQHGYKEKYYKKLMPLSEKYSEVTFYEILYQALTSYINCQVTFNYINCYVFSCI